MSFTENEIRTLCAANAERGWPTVPDDAPESIRRGILERRARALGYRAAAPNADLRKRLDAAMQLPALNPAEVQARLKRLTKMAENW